MSGYSELPPTAGLLPYPLKTRSTFTRHGLVEGLAGS
jgi:hypothetical protein